MYFNINLWLSLYFMHLQQSTSFYGGRVQLWFPLLTLQEAWWKIKLYILLMCLQHIMHRAVTQQNTCSSAPPMFFFFSKFHSWDIILPSIISGSNSSFQWEQNHTFVSDWALFKICYTAANLQKISIYGLWYLAVKIPEEQSGTRDWLRLH